MRVHNLVWSEDEIVQNVRKIGHLALRVSKTIDGFRTFIFSTKRLGSTFCMVFMHFSTVPHSGIVSLSE